MEEQVMTTPSPEFPVELTGNVTHGFFDTYFGTIDLGHQNRNRAFKRVANQIARHPGGTLPEKLPDRNDYESMDRTMNRPETTHEFILAAHRQNTVAKMEAYPGVVLGLHDTTVLDYSGHKTLRLAPVGNGQGSGYLCHNSLAVAAETGEVFGLTSQILHQRVAVGKNESVKAKRERKSRESRLWSQAVEQAPVAPEGKRWVDVCDRGADLFEFLATEQRLGRHCLVRSAYNRRIRLGHDGLGRQTLLQDHLRTLPAEGEQSKVIYDRQLKRERPARLCVSSAAVEILPPHVKKGEYDKIPIRAWAVRVWEESANLAGAAKLEWFLVSQEPVTGLEAAWQMADWYSRRWIVEEYHKAQKTGCRIESLQFRSEDALQPMIALLSVVAVLLLNLRDAARRPDAKESQASEVVDPIYEEVLRAHHYKTERDELSVYEFYMGVARLGGYMSRKRGDFPGWITLWRGWQKLESIVTGAKIERKRRLKIRVVS
jgi:hypothetical protein